MSGKNGKKLIALGALAALVAVLVPAGLASGSDASLPVTGGEESVVLLTLGKTDEVTWEALTQKITSRRNDCLSVELAAIDALLEISADGGELGLWKDGLGVQSEGEGSGEPCGRTKAGEAISVSLGADLDGYLMTAVDVDLELKFNAVVDVTLYHDGGFVASDTFNPMEGSDDGPDSKDGDNYRYFFRPENSNGDQLYFDEVKFVAISGSFSLEAGADGTDDGSLAPNNSSQFEIVQVFDGEITCGGSVTVQDEAVQGVLGEVTMRSMNFDGPEGIAWYTTDCLLKLYNDGVTSASLFFIPQLENTQSRYTITITIDDQPITTNGDGQITSLTMEYNAEGNPTPLQALQVCKGQPNTETGDSGYEAFWIQSDVGLLPAGETACYYGVSVQPTGIDPDTLETIGTEVWKIYFEDDPGFSWK